MPRQVVFPCPSCGASLSVEEGASSDKCQFCGSTAVVPVALRGAAPQPNYSYAPPAPSSSPAGNMIAGLDAARVRAIGDAVRAGNKAEATRLYQEMFGGDSFSAQQAVDSLAAGQRVLVGTTAMGAPEYFVVDGVAPAAPYAVPAMPYMTPIYSPVYTNSNSAWRSIFGLNIAITVLVGLFTLCITGVVVLPIILLMVPGLWTGLAQIFSQLTSR